MLTDMVAMRLAGYFPIEDATSNGGDASRVGTKQKKKEKAKSTHPHQQRQSKKSFGANNFMGWHMCLSSLTQRGILT